MPLRLTSQSFRDGDYLPEVHVLSKDFGFGCAGANQSPHLAWSDASGAIVGFNFNFNMWRRRR